MKKLIIALLVLVSGAAYSQQDLTLYNMRYLQQASFTNPAFFPECKVNVGIPALSGGQFRVGNSGFVYKDLVELGSDDSLRLTPVNALNGHEGIELFRSRAQNRHYSFWIQTKQRRIISA